jgi:hypothetical protein
MTTSWEWVGAEGCVFHAASPMVRTWASSWVSGCKMAHKTVLGCSLTSENRGALPSLSSSIRPVELHKAPRATEKHASPSSCSWVSSRMGSMGLEWMRQGMSSGTWRTVKSMALFWTVRSGSLTRESYSSPMRGVTPDGYTVLSLASSELGSRLHHDVIALLGNRFLGRRLESRGFAGLDPRQRTALP